jgi:type III pantothenate kinase
MYLTIDAGNTFLKAAVFSTHGEILQAVHAADATTLAAQLDMRVIVACIISSVGEEDFSIFREHIARCIFLRPDTPIPIINKYSTPDTLGMDRLAVACGAAYLQPHQHNIIIDAGTCIKCDIITSQQEYLGGSISPGVTMRYRALHHFTARLPELSIEMTHDTQLIGDSTDASIHSGVMLGAIYELQQRIDAYRLIYQDANIFLTGGDTKIFENTLKGVIFVEKNLSLIGLYNIVQQHVD